MDAQLGLEPHQPKAPPPPHLLATAQLGQDPHQPNTQPPPHPLAFAPMEKFLSPTLDGGTRTSFLSRYRRSRKEKKKEKAAQDLRWCNEWLAEEIRWLPENRKPLIRKWFQKKGCRFFRTFKKLWKRKRDLWWLE